MRFGRFLKSLDRQPPFAKGNFFQAGDLQPLPELDDFNKVSSRGQILVTARVQPSGSAPQDLDRKLARLKVSSVQIGDFQFSPLGGLEFLGKRRCVLVIKIQAGNGIVGARTRGFSSRETARPSSSKSTTP